MPEDVLQELETAAPVAGNLKNIEDLVRVVAREVGFAAEGMKGSALLFETAWRRIVMDVARGETTRIQAARPQFLSVFEKRLGFLKSIHDLATWLGKLNWAEGPDPDVLRPEIAGMERLKACVFGQWKTADDLEDLAAKDYPLTTADLDRIGPQRRPPASYYAEESKPF